MKKGQITSQNCTIKKQNNIHVFFSEKHQVFYVKGRKNHLPKDYFKSLITCENEIFNDFLKYLAQFKSSVKPHFYTYLELEDKLNSFLIKRAGNCKTVA